MTTNVTIDTHAGWDVEVIYEDQQQPPKGLEVFGKLPWKSTKQIVPANTLTQIAIWDTRRIISIKELPRNV